MLLQVDGKAEASGAQLARVHVPISGSEETLVWIFWKKLTSTEKDVCTKKKKSIWTSNRQAAVG